jgi:hypothetical protein
MICMTVMGVAPRLGVPVYHHTDHVLRADGHRLYRRLPTKPESSKSGKIAGSSKSSGAITLPASARQHNTAGSLAQVLGTTLKETTDALVPLTKELLDGVSEDTEAAAEV